MVAAVSRPIVSIIVPTLDDTEPLARLLSALETGPEIEILVVNGAVSDRRLDALTAHRRDVRFLSSPAGRGRQMNVGAWWADGRWFVFLHADTRLPPNWLDELRRADRDRSVVGGSFRFQLDSDAWQARCVERGVGWRVRWLDLAYGDQALFVRRDAFQALGGYREWPLMEDVDFVRRLRQLGRLYHSPLPVVTSARRWERDGWWRRSAENIAIQMLFFAGASPAWLARRYLRRADAHAHSEALVVMARAPSDSSGKSRLTRDLPRDHVELRRAILLDTLDAVRRVSRADVWVAFEPADAAAEFQSLTGITARLIPQLGGTLGDRMRNVFADLFADGYSTIVMVGSDLPTLPPAYVEHAFDQLGKQKNPVVIGPAVDGGYYLIGLRALCAELFDSIPWGTQDVLATTLKAAETLQLPVSLAPRWYDIDSLDDLRRVARETAPAARTRSWIAAHRELAAAADGPEVTYST
jgi:rSAM/selenodomain-associated transferase 2/rSAM/selenodomain-associated transferase 1